jgi:hypothetical protein
LYSEVKEELGNSDLQFSVTNELPMGNWHERDNAISNYFRRIKNGSNDPIIGVIKMLDYNQRVARSADLDNELIQKILDSEQDRRTRNNKSMQSRKDLSLVLNGEDESNLISSSIQTISGDVHRLKNEVTEAQLAEEEALRVSS